VTQINGAAYRYHPEGKSKLKTGNGSAGKDLLRTNGYKPWRANTDGPAN
jgi:hypothetical protein